MVGCWEKGHADLGAWKQQPSVLAEGGVQSESSFCQYLVGSDDILWAWLSFWPFIICCQRKLQLRHLPVEKWNILCKDYCQK